MAYDLPTELFTELGIGVVVFGLRFFTRWRVGGSQSFGLDDMFAGIAIIFWILEATFLFTCGYFGNNIGLNSETAEAIPDSEVPRIIKGSKHAYVAWVFYILLIWTLKMVLLFLYNRLTMGLWQQKLAKIMMGVSAATFLASLFWHIFSCFPTYRAWQVKPFPGDDCTLRRGNYIIITTLDVLTDIGIMAIPLPMLLQSSLSVRRKVSLGVLFSSGVFIMICAVLRAYYSLRDIQTLSVALGWASREILVASIVVCAPALKPLFSSAKKKLSSAHGSQSWNSNGFGPRSGHSKLSDHGNMEDPEGHVATITSGGQKTVPSYKMSVINRARPERDHTPSSESQEDIYHPSKSTAGRSDSSMEEPGIQVTTEYTVSRY
ncbi:hypothetical protein F4809DRAFT_589372 [Biscogniauxia mediterranea]|nr:hypothetical protein F4809DRAFT_589372 [Biscogniauxia mediterranea]